MHCLVSIPIALLTPPGLVGIAGQTQFGGLSHLLLQVRPLLRRVSNGTLGPFLSGGSPASVAIPIAAH